MNTIPFTNVIRYKANIDGQLANAVAALRVADTKLGKVVADYDRQEQDRADLMEARYNARTFVVLLTTYTDAQDGVSATPTLPSRVFRALMTHENESADNAPHVEGAILALMLAGNSLEAALTSAGQLDGDDVDVGYETAYAAHGVIRQYLGSLVCSAYVFDHDAALDAILASKLGKRTMALVAA